MAITVKSKKISKLNMTGSMVLEVGKMYLICFFVNYLLTSVILIRTRSFLKILVQNGLLKAVFKIKLDTDGLGSEQQTCVGFGLCFCFLNCLLFRSYGLLIKYNDQCQISWTQTKLHNNLDHHHPGDKQRRSQTAEEALSKAN